MTRVLGLRILAILSVVLGLDYIVWRWLVTVEWSSWWIAVPLVLAETYTLIDTALFGLTMWRSRMRPAPPTPEIGLTVDVFISTYDEPVEVVALTAAAARDIRYPHLTWILDDGGRPEMEEAAERLGVGYIPRGHHWNDLLINAKEGNLNNALMATEGQLLLLLNADEVPVAHILESTLGYFSDPKVAIVQTAQLLREVPASDPFGSQDRLFNGPIQQGKDGWNASFFCGSAAVLRREALMQLGVTRFVGEMEHAVTRRLKFADLVLADARLLEDADEPLARELLRETGIAIVAAQTSISDGQPISATIHTLRDQVDDILREFAAMDLHLQAIRLPAARPIHQSAPNIRARGWHDDGDPIGHDLSVLEAITSISTLLAALDVDRSNVAQPQFIPLATISVTEDLATTMRLHSLGWKSVFHNELLAVSAAPDSLAGLLRQRLLWSQTSLQVLLKENPLLQRGMTIAQRLLYFSTMWGYLNGFATVVYLATPVIFLCFGVLPLHVNALEFSWRYAPFVVVSITLFAVAGRGVPTLRSQRFSFALFPVWIRGFATAIRRVAFGRELFDAAPLDRKIDAGWRLLLRVQLIAAAVLVVAALIGIARVGFGVGEPGVTVVCLIWVVFDLDMLAVLIPAVLYMRQRPVVE